METPEQKLAGLRARIDAVDESLAKLFIERIGIIREVAALKAEHWPKSCHIRPGREGQMHRALAKRFTGTGFPPLMALAMWRQLIGGSTHLESPLNIAYLADHPDHYYLAREYFGLQIGATKVTTLADALKQFANGKSNILILPHPSKNDWWRDAAALEEHNLKIFAALPLVEGNAPNESINAVALAALTPEDSGDDISYFLGTNGALEIIPGFAITNGNSQYLGTHPCPVQLTLGAVHV